MTVTVGSLFTGIGGLDLGLEQAGMTIAWQVEIEPSARRILDRHWPNVPCHPDVKELSGDGLANVDVLCGGFPCQDLSVAGRRAGLAGERSGLFHEFMRLAAELAPRWVVIENVPGLLSSNGGRDMGTVVGTLADLGYGWAYRVLDAQYFGVAQRRRRVFIVGCASGRADRACQVLFEPESSGRDTPPSREPGTGSTVGTLGGTSPGGGWRFGADEAAAGQLVPALTTRAGCTYDDQQTGQLVPVGFHLTQDPIHEDGLTPAMSAGNKHSCSTLGVAYNPYRTLEKDGTITSGFAARPVVDALHGPTGNKEPLVLDCWTAGDEDVPQGHRVYKPEGIAPALGTTSGSSAPLVLPQMAVRRLLPLECERLQGFPDGWTNGENDSARYARLGNAVAVPVARWIRRRILEAHQ